MKKVFIINGVEPYSWAPARLNATFVDIAREYFESNGCEVNVTKVCEEYDIEAEVDKTDYFLFRALHVTYIFCLCFCEQ